MKKLIVMSLIGLMSLTANAKDNKVEVGYRYDVGHNAPDQQAVLVDFQRKVASNFSLGFGLDMSERNTDNKMTNRYSLTSSYDLGKFYVNGQLGQKHVSGVAHTEFWTLESGVKYNFNKRTQLKLGYAYRRGFGGKLEDYHEGPRVAVKYALDKQYSVSVKYDRFQYLNNVDRDRIGVFFESKF